MSHDDSDGGGAPQQPTLSWVSMVRTARATVAFSIVVVAALWFLPQMADMLVVRDYWNNAPGAGFAFHAGLLLFALSAWYWSRTVLAARFEFPDDGGTGGGGGPRRSVRYGLPVEPKSFVLLPRLLFAAIVFGGLVAALRSAAYVDAVIVVLWAIPVCLLLIFRRRLRAWRGRSRSGPGTSGPPTPGIAT